MGVEWLAVGVGGFIGSCVRYALTKAAAVITADFPLGTLGSNVIAGFFIGFILVAEKRTGRISPRMKIFLTTGLLGGLSTFSTFSLETVQFFQQERYVYAAGNILLNLTLSLLGVAAGMYAAGLLFTET